MTDEELPCVESLDRCIPGPACDAEVSCVTGSVCGGLTENVAATDGDCASNLEGSCCLDEPACYKVSDVAGDSHASGKFTTGCPEGAPVGYGSNNVAA